MRHLFIGSVSGLALLAIAPIAHAQTAAEDGDSLDLDEVVITSSPIAREIGRSITSSSVIEDEDLAERVAGNSAQ